MATLMAKIHTFAWMFANGKTSNNIILLLPNVLCGFTACSFLNRKRYFQLINFNIM